MGKHVQVMKKQIIKVNGEKNFCKILCKDIFLGHILYVGREYLLP